MKEMTLRSQLSRAGFKPLHAAAVKSRGGEPWSQGVEDVPQGGGIPPAGLEPGNEIRKADGNQIAQLSGRDACRLIMA